MSFLEIKLIIDGKTIDLNEFVVKILSGTIVGAVTSLREVTENWKEIQIQLTK